MRSLCEGVKRLRHPVLGEIALDYSGFAVDGRPDLAMLVYNPGSPADAERIRSLIAAGRGNGPTRQAPSEGVGGEPGQASSA